MEQTTISIQVLTPSEGMYLTQKNRSEDQEPIMSKKVINPQDEWVEISVEEGDAIIAQWQSEQELEIRKEDTSIQEQQITDATVNTLNSTTNYIPPMEIFKGKYYMQDNTVYECIRNSEKPLNNNLCDLIGLYVYKV